MENEKLLSTGRKSQLRSLSKLRRHQKARTVCDLLPSASSFGPGLHHPVGRGSVGVEMPALLRDVGTPRGPTESRFPHLLTVVRPLILQGGCTASAGPTSISAHQSGSELPLAPTRENAFRQRLCLVLSLT